MPAQTDRDLADLDFTLVAMCGLAVASIVAATTALAEANRPAAENALALTSELTAMSGPAETQILSLLGRPSPQSGTIRHAVAGVHLTGDIVRMGEHAGRIAEIVRERYRELPRGGGREILLQMGLLAHELALKAYQALINHDAGSGNTIDTHNHDMRLLRAELHTDVLGTALDTHTPDVIDAIVLAGLYERFGDGAVAVCRHIEGRFASTADPTTP